MIKAEVIFDGDKIECNGMIITTTTCDSILINGYCVSISRGIVYINIDTLEKAIKYCMGEFE